MITCQKKCKHFFETIIKNQELSWENVMIEYNSWLVSCKILYR